MGALKNPDKRITFLSYNFVIKWRHLDEKKQQLIGPGRYHLLVGEHFKEKHFTKVIDGGKDFYEFTIRGKFVITFKSK